MQDPTATVQISPVDRARGQFEVVAYKHGTDGNVAVIFDCDSERDALDLRTAIRDSAASMRRVHDYRSEVALATRDLIDAVRLHRASYDAFGREDVGARDKLHAALDRIDGLHV